MDALDRSLDVGAEDGVATFVEARSRMLALALRTLGNAAEAEDGRRLAVSTVQLRRIAGAVLDATQKGDFTSVEAVLSGDIGLRFESRTAPPRRSLDA